MTVVLPIGCRGARSGSTTAGYKLDRVGQMAGLSAYGAISEAVQHDAKRKARLLAVRLVRISLR